MAPRRDSSGRFSDPVSANDPALRRRREAIEKKQAEARRRLERRGSE